MNYRTSLVLLLLFACTLAACTSTLLGGTGAPAGRPIGTDARGAETVDQDNRISAIIRNRFRADGELRDASLTVVTRRGRVTLQGHVPSFDLRDRAMRLATDVSGVTDVSNHIAIRP